MKSTRPVLPAAIQGKKCVPASVLTFTGIAQLVPLSLECVNQISKTAVPLIVLRLSAKTEYTFPCWPGESESSTASVAKMSSVLVFEGPLKIKCASHTVSPPRIAFDFQRALERSEEHTSELQSLTNLVCRLLLEKKNDQTIKPRRD